MKRLVVSDSAGKILSIADVSVSDDRSAPTSFGVKPIGSQSVAEIELPPEIQNASFDNIVKDFRLRKIDGRFQLVRATEQPKGCLSFLVRKR